MKKFFAIVCIFLYSEVAFAGEVQNKFPDFAKEYLGVDRFENFNRKVFQFNNKLNKYAIRPVTIVWSSIMPKYGMERIKNAYSNVLYPRRLVSSLCQGDIKAAGRASARFLVNSTVGLAGMFDPAKKFLKIEPVNEDMEQALAKWKMKAGPYLVLPILYSATPRALLGRALDSALDPSCYVGTPVVAAVKAGFTVNNATLFQPLSKFFENNYIDPYDVVKKAYGVSLAILNSNLDRKENLEKNEDNEVSKVENFYPVSISKVIEGSASTDEVLYDDELIPDIILKDFNPQHPVIDSMRTALFELDGIDASFWGELSPWNHSFKNRIKTDTIELAQNRAPYKFRFIMQKDKSAPLAIIFPSIGESVDTHHSTTFAKLFYDEGYSVLILSSAFHYSFVKSLEEGYCPGIPSRDTEYLKRSAQKIISKLENKYGCNFSDKIVLGTSFGALSALYLAEDESRENKINISKYISINPPIELLYAIGEIDKNNEDWAKNPDNIKEKTALTAGKIVNLYKEKGEAEDFKIGALPFSPKEAKLITGFILRQKLTDLLFAIENIPLNKKTDFYERTNKIGYVDYVKKYLLNEKYPELNDISQIASLHNIKDFLINNSNYRIYHTLDDYLVNKDQLKALKKYAGAKMTLIDKGSHLGFLYREEFLEDLKKEISLKNKVKL